MQIYATIGDDSIKKTIFEADSDNLRQWPCKWLIYFRHYWTKKCHTKKARWLNLFDSDNFGRQWLTRGARTGAAPENAPLRLAILWYNYENAPSTESTSHNYCKMHPPCLPLATLWYNCTPASFGTNIALYQVILGTTTLQHFTYCWKSLHTISLHFTVVYLLVPIF